ncbi:uncharacterized protein VTP21DRAFT_7894 [Calcarisporiella thermophila]|uniref:uncharacterized protein n=1 Tax=Calcarisporiella thermophila TaxID=911321 RepID=UPI0037439A22
MQEQVRVGIGCFVLHPKKNDLGHSQFVLGKRIGSHGAGTWQLPGGHLEFGESFEECAVREVFEETGLRIKNVEFCTTTNDYMPTDGKHYVTVFMKGVCVDEEPIPKTMEPLKCEGWRWTTWDEVAKLESPYRPLFTGINNILVKNGAGFSP